MKASKSKKITYAYTLINSPDSEIEKTIGDYILAENAEAAYDIAVNVCNNINKKYGTDYFVQTVTPN